VERVREINCRAVQYLLKGYEREGFDQLQDAQKLTAEICLEPSKHSADELSLAFMTYLNLASFYKGFKKYADSLQCLSKVMDLQKQHTRDLLALAHTYLKVAVILAMQNMHKESLNFAEKAVCAFESLRKSASREASALEEERNGGGSPLPASCLLEQTPSLEYGLAHSYYLAGLSLLRVGDRTKAHDYFTSGYEQAVVDIGPSMDLTRNMKKRRDGLASFARAQLKEVVAPDSSSVRPSPKYRKEILMKVRQEPTPSVGRPAVKLYRPLKTEAGSLL
jgi:tetratricopeptide (TPR) repeat protein